MILDWALSAVAVSGVVAAAAVIAEQAARLRQAATRLIWLGAMVASLSLPLLPLVPATIPGSVDTADTAQGPLKLYMPSVDLPPIPWTPVRQHQSQVAVLAFKIAWCSASMGMFVFLWRHVTWYRSRQRRWRRDALSCNALYVSDTTGPGVFGFFRPSIVVPEWFREIPRVQQALILAHERTHISARDPALVLAGFIALALCPWNLPLWWLFARLRRAIELDCDRRVLSAGANPRAYGETLIAVAEMSSGKFGVALSMTEGQSLLKRRIVAMSEARTKAPLAIPLTLIGIAAVVATAAAQIRTSGEPATPEHAQLVKVDSAVLKQYEGAYQYSDTTIMRVTPVEDHLRVSFTGQNGADEIYPQSATTFFYVQPSVDASIEFDGARRAILRQNGMETAMARLDEDTAAAIERAVSARVENQIADTRSEDALQRLITDIYEGRIDEHLVNAQLAGALRTDLPKLQVRLAKLGHPTGYTLQRVSSAGGDEYLVTHEHGVSQWSLVLDAQGTITGATVPL